ncbi:MAG: acyl-CoA dehydrogenase family protein, partial [Pseudomonadota bacterium]|nr:acyl-CoA dehydrogenase family protein [Pseudomonadota bacterium]
MAMAGLQVPDPDWHSTEIALLGDTCRRFYLEECAPRYEQWEKQGHVDRDIWLKAGAIGLLCPSVPEAYGGSGGTFAHDAVIAHGATRFGVDGLGLALHNSIVTPYLLNYGSEDQKRRWLPKLASGESIAAIAMTEPAAGSDLQGIRMTAKRRGNHYVLNGQKTFITNGQLAGLIVVVAKTDPSMGAKGTSLFVVETEDSGGFRRGRNLDK